MQQSSPETAFHPGAYLRELLIWQHLGFDEFSELSGIPELKVTEIVARRRRIDRHLSEELAAYFGNSAQFWLDLQRNYDRRDRGDVAAL